MGRSSLWRDKDFTDFWLVSAGANAGSVTFRWIGCDQSPGAVARGALERIQSNRVCGGRGSAPRPRPTAARQGAVGKPRVRHRYEPRGSGAPLRCTGKRPGLWQNGSNSFRTGWGRRDLTGPCRTDGTSRGTGRKRVQRFPAGGYPSHLGGCQRVTDSIGLTLPRPLSTTKIINTVAGQLAVSA